MSETMSDYIAGMSARIIKLERELAEACEHLDAIRQCAAEQAEDDGLWFYDTTAPEAYFQQELRRLHEIIER